MNSREVVEAFFAYWGVQDVEMTCALFDDNIVYKLYVTRSVLPFGGEWRGLSACRNNLFSILEEFDYLSYEPTLVSVRGRVVRAHVRFKYQHRRTGGILEGTRRLVFHVRNGRIMQMHGFHDAQLVDAFMQLTQYRMAASQFARAPELPRRVIQRSE
jgi:ketosteroid isomerase-like protein